jgi:hypothetical protein
MGLPLLPRIAFFLDFALACLVGRLMQATGEGNNPGAFLLLAPLIANALLILRVRWCDLFGYARILVVIGLFLYAIRADLSHLSPGQTFFTLVVAVYHVIYGLMVFWHARSLKRLRQQA